MTTTCADHTYGPDSYQAWMDWAEEMSKTHTQERCGECGYWAIWVATPEKTATR